MIEKVDFVVSRSYPDAFQEVRRDEACDEHSWVNYAAWIVLSEMDSVESVAKVYALPLARAVV